MGLSRNGCATRARRNQREREKGENECGRDEPERQRANKHFVVARDDHDVSAGRDNATKLVALRKFILLPVVPVILRAGVASVRARSGRFELVQFIRQAHDIYCQNNTSPD